MDKSPISRFMNKVRKQPDGCWVWIGANNGNGYGQFVENGKKKRGHVWAFEHWKHKVPAGLEIDHKCRNPSCVNPDHLEAVTHKVNVLRGTSQTAKNAAKINCPKCGRQFIVCSDGHRRCYACKLQSMRRYQRRLQEAKR